MPKSAVVLLIVTALCWATVLGCAQGVKYLATGLTNVHNAFRQADALLNSLDTVYAILLANQQGATEAEATRALAVADAAAEGLRKVIETGTATDAEMNLLAGQVDGAKAFLKSVEEK